MAAKRNIEVINLIYIMAVALSVLFYSLIFTLMSINAATAFNVTPSFLHITIQMRILLTAFNVVSTFQLHAWRTCKRKLDHIIC